MTKTNDADTMNAWLAALRGDLECAPDTARGRIAERLAGAGLVASAAGATLALGSAARRGFLHSQLLAVILALPAGVLIGAAGHAWLAPPTPVRAAVASPARALPAAALPVEPAPVVVEALPQQAEPARAVDKPRLAVSAVESQAAAVEPPGLEGELLLLEQARTRLSEGQPSATLALLREHRSSHPSSPLEQEREALMVRALVAAGRKDEARRHAEGFAQRFPGSVLLPSVERAVGTFP